VGAPRLFWYVSVAKLTALGADRRGWSDRLRASVGFNVGPAMAELGLDPASAAGSDAILKLVRRAERQLADDRHLIDVEQVPEYRGPTYFSWEGPSARAAVQASEEHAFWVASLVGQVGVLLVGSVRHAIGAAAAVPVTFSPSYDPIGAVGRFFEPTNDEPLEPVGMHDDWAAAGWQEVMRSSVGEIASLPRTRGIAQYAGSFSINRPLSASVRAGEGQVHQIVIGSPLWVEQIAERLT